MYFHSIDRDSAFSRNSNDVSMSIDPPTSPRPVPQQSKSSIPFLLNESNRPQSPLELYLPAPPRCPWSAPAEVILVQIDDVDEVHPAGQTWIKSRESDNEDDEESGYMYESDVAQPPNLPPISSILFTPDPSIGSPRSSPMCSPRASSATSSSATAPQFGGVTSSESSSSSSPLGWLNGPVEDAFSSPRWTSTPTFSSKATAGGAQQYAHSPREPAVATTPRSEQLQESSGYVFHSSPRSQATGGTTPQQQAWASWTQNGASGSFRTQPTSATTVYYPLVSAPISRNSSSGDTAASPSYRGCRGTSPAAMLSSFRQGAISHSAPSLLPGQKSQQHLNQNNHHQNMHANTGKANSTISNGSSATSSPRGLASLRQGAISVSSPSLLSSVGGAQSASAAPAFPSPTDDRSDGDETEMAPCLRGDKLHPQWVMTESRNHSTSMAQSSPHSPPNPDSAHGDPLGKRKRGRGSPGASAGGDFTFLHLQVGNDGRLTMVKELN